MSETIVFPIGTRVKVIDQGITGTIVRHDTGNKWVVLDDDRDMWRIIDGPEAEEGVLVFRASELKEIGNE